MLGQKNEQEKKRKYKLDCNSHAEVVVVTAESHCLLYFRALVNGLKAIMPLVSGEVGTNEEL